MNWLVKEEPEAYSWAAFVKERGTAWTGVRNYQARNNLRAMKKGDLVFFYHSVSEKQIVGVARVEKESYPDPTAKDGDWVCVDLVPVRERVFQLYRRAAEPSLPEARLWGIWSPRQIMDHVRTKKPSPGSWPVSFLTE